MRKLVLGCAIALGLMGVAHAEPLRYVIVVDSGNVAGEQTVETGADGTTRVHFIFKDNGRGPEIDEEYRLLPDGTFADYRIRGTSTFGAPIDERFTLENGVAKWSSKGDSGEQKVAGTALYSSLGGTSDATVAIAALAKTQDGTLPLLPSGTLRQRVLGEAEVESDGQKRRVQLLALTGVGLTPSLIWATTGDEPRLFADITPGYSTQIEAGWEQNGAALLKQQVEAENQLLRDIAKRQFTPLPGLTVIRNARVFDSEHATLGAASDVYVLRGRITAVLPGGSPNAGADNEIDAAGRVMLPGLFDMHGHVDRWDGGLNLAAGVTTVRDMGNDNATLQEILGEIERGELLSPQVVPAGFLEGESKFSARNGFVVKNIDEARHAIDWYAQHGYPQLKIYNSFPKEILRDTVAYAHERGLRVSGHVPAFLRAQDVVDAGFDEIQHINQVLLNFFVDDTTDTRTLERFYLPAKQTAGLDFDGKPVQDFIASLKQHGVVIDPTLTTFDFLRQRDGKMMEAYAAVASHWPPDLQRGRMVAEMDVPDDAAEALYTKSYEKMIEFVGRMYKAGIPIVAGTDEIAGFTLHRELELYVMAGLTPAQALQVATWNGAKYSRTLDDRGSITPGKRADLVLVDGDPTQDINAIRRTALVITQGRAVSPAAVHTELGIKPFVDGEIAVRSTAKAVVR